LGIGLSEGIIHFTPLGDFYDITSSTRKHEFGMVANGALDELGWAFWGQGDLG
jgi:hypothetical protein